MYQNVFVENRWDDEPVVHLWDDDAGYNTFEFPNFAFVRNETGEYRTLKGDPAMKIAKADLTWKRKKELEEVYGEDAVHESDVPIETRVLLDIYGGEEEPSTGHCRLFYDIEVSTVGGYPNIDKADKKITSVAFWDDASCQMRVFILEDEDLPNTEDVEVTVFGKEKDLLRAYVKAWRDVDPTILVTYNGDRFDNPYLYRRLERVFGEGYGDKLSPIEKTSYNERSGIYKFAGISSFDYLKIYKNFKFSELSSYSLDNVAKTELDRGKIEYVGREVNGEVIENLDDLKRLDPERFIEYNAVDVELMMELDDKLGFIEMAKFIAHLGHVPYESVYQSSRFIEGAILDSLHSDGIVAPNKSHNTLGYKTNSYHELYSEEIKVSKPIHKDVPRKGTLGLMKTKTTKKRRRYKRVTEDSFVLEKPLDFSIDEGRDVTLEFEGAYVKEPIPGVYEWFFDLDLTSMYPCIIMSLNISPETKMGKVLKPEWNPKLFADGSSEEVEVRIFETGIRKRFSSLGDFKTWCTDNNYAVAANGAVYDNSEIGVIPQVLKRWFNNRQEYKKKRNEAEDAGDGKLAEYYDIQQHNRKILINSVYGVLGMPRFRFYDLDNAEATTLTGQSTIKFTQQMGDEYYNRRGRTDVPEKTQACIYTDTDSVFYSAKPLVDVDLNSVDQQVAVEKTITAAKKLQGYLNRSYDFYAKDMLGIQGEHMFDIKQELVASRGFWIRKKRYAQWIVNDEGHPTSKLDVVGMDIIRSDFPEAFNDVMENVVKTVLKELDEDKSADFILDFKEGLEQEPLARIANPTGVGDVEGWRGDTQLFRKRAPVHSKAAIVYNELLKEFELDKQVPGIEGGDKMKWVYLHSNPYGYNQVGFKNAGNPGRVMDFVEQYADREKMYRKSLESKLRDLYSAIGWQFPSLGKRNAANFFDF